MRVVESEELVASESWGRHVAHVLAVAGLTGVLATLFVLAVHLAR
jgi:hypothetical protein